MTANANNDKTINSRQQAKKLRFNKSKVKEEQDKDKVKRGNKRPRIRLVPIWLRLIIISLLVVGSIILGAVVGYSIIGEGEATDVFKKATWTHILDIINED